jgi:hypothetical protein
MSRGGFAAWVGFLLVALAFAAWLEFVLWMGDIPVVGPS